MQPHSPGVEILIVAGEASGDLHAARLLSELNQIVPNLRSFGLGGSELAAAGLEPVADSAEISVVGITEVVKILPRARAIFNSLLTEVDRRGTKIALLVDSPDFNLRLAKQLVHRGVRVLYYISPQVWAWRRGRVRIIRRLVEKMMVILPFEVDFFADHGVDAEYVGHPLVDEVPQLPQAWEAEPEPDGVRIALLPGSRASEIRSNLPAILGAARILGAKRDCRFTLVRAASVSRSAFDPYLEGVTDVDVEIIAQDRFRVIANAHLAICASGTATLEVGLLGTPMVVVYRISPWTYFIGKRLVKLPHIALVNLVLGRSVVPELLQHEASPDRIAAVCNKLLSDRDRIRQMRSDLGELRQTLGERGASRRVAEAVASEIAVGKH